MKKSEFKELVIEAIKEQLNEEIDTDSMAKMLADIEKLSKKMLYMWTAGKYKQVQKIYPDFIKLVNTVEKHINGV